MSFCFRLLHIIRVQKSEAVLYNFYGIGVIEFFSHGGLPPSQNGAQLSATTPSFLRAGVSMVVLIQHPLHELYLQLLR
jgi:hypothetical protein